MLVRLNKTACAAVPFGLQHPKQDSSPTNAMANPPAAVMRVSPEVLRLIVEEACLQDSVLSVYSIMLRLFALG
jgi:hypothetical protein